MPLNPRMRNPKPEAPHLAHLRRESNFAMRRVSLMARRWAFAVEPAGRLHCGFSSDGARLAQHQHSAIAVNRPCSKTELQGERTHMKAGPSACPSALLSAEGKAREARGPGQGAHDKKFAKRGKNIKEKIVKNGPQGRLAVPAFLPRMRQRTLTGEPADRCFVCCGVRPRLPKLCWTSMTPPGAISPHLSS